MKRILSIVVVALSVALFSCDKENEDTVEPIQPEWKLTYAGFQKVKNSVNNQQSDSLVSFEADVFVVDCPPESCHFPFLCSASTPNKYEGMTPAVMASSIIDEFLSGATGYDSLRIQNIIFSYDDTIICRGMMAGDYIMYVFEVDSQHVPTGKYASCTFHKEDSGAGHMFAGTPQSVPDWNVCILDSTLSKRFSPNGLDSIWNVGAQIKTPGIKYFTMLLISPYEFYDAYYGCIEYVLSRMEERVQRQLNSGKTMDDIFRKGAETPYWINYKKPLKLRVYILEADENGKATGRYGLTEVVLP